MLKFDKLPLVSRDRPVKGQIWKEEKKNHLYLWEIVEVWETWGEIKVRLKVIYKELGDSAINHPVGPVGHVTPLLSWGNMERLEWTWTCVSLPRTEVKVGQVWYCCNGNNDLMHGTFTVSELNGMVKFTAPVAAYKTSLLNDWKGWCLISEPETVTVKIPADFAKFEEDCIGVMRQTGYPQQKGEKKMFTQSHRISEVVLKQVDQQTINSGAHDVAKLFGYIVHLDDKGKVFFRKPGKLVNAFEATPESIEKLFRDRIIKDEDDLTILDAAADFGIVEKVVFVECEEK